VPYTPAEYVPPEYVMPTDYQMSLELAPAPISINGGDYGGWF